MSIARSIEITRRRRPDQREHSLWAVALALCLAAAACRAPDAATSVPGSAPDGGPTAGGSMEVGEAAEARAEPLAEAQGPELIVLNAVGRPAAGARVWLVDRSRLRPDQAVVASRTLGDWVATTRRIATEEALADDAGRVRFRSEPREGFLVAAELQELFGAAERRGVAEESITLRLVPRKRYYIRVHDAAGAPASGVPVTLGVVVGDDTRRLPATAFTDAEGLATLFEPPAAAFIAAEAAAPSAADYGRIAIVRIPSRSQPRVTAQPEGVATIVLPPTAPLSIRATHRRFEADHWRGLVQVFRAADGTRSDETLAVELIAGRATLPHVEVDADLRVVAVIGERDAPGDTSGDGRYVGTTSQAIRGASAMGERLDCALQLDGGVLVTGRCVDSDGVALANQPIDVFIVGEPATGWTVVTQDDGAFRWLLARVDRGLVGARVGFRAGRRGAGELGRAVVPLAPPATEPERGALVDLGDVTLD